MREIYFRGKDLDGNWREGDLIWATLGQGQKPMILDAFDECDIDNNLYEVDPETVGQYTGLRDAEGREIYEGDILSNGHDTVAVSYSIEFAAFVGLYNGREDLVLNLDDCIDQPLDELKLKVVGNVHDNPDLLEAAHD